MLIYEYKLNGNKQQYQAIEEAIRVVQFIRNKCLRKWMDVHGVSRNDLQCYCVDLAREYPFAARLNSQARQVAADRAWAAIARFYENCHNKKPGKKGYPTFRMTIVQSNTKIAGGSWNRMGVISPSLMVVALGVFA